MIVISDTSALSALAEAGLLDLLPRLFGVVVIPEAARRECVHPRAPRHLRDWICPVPDWLEIVADPKVILAETAGLDPGEAAAITLAWENRNSAMLILDEKRGRRVAETLGLPKTGVLGIIGDAADRGWVEFDEAVGRLLRTGFHISEHLIEAIRARLRSG